MPLMDVHTRSETLALRGVAHAHAATVRGRGRHHVHYLRYWVDETRGKIFCLVDAPDANAPAAVARRTYSLLAKEITDNQLDPPRFDTAQIFRLHDAG